MPTKAELEKALIEAQTAEALTNAAKLEEELTRSRFLQNENDATDDRNCVYRYVAEVSDHSVTHCQAKLAQWSRRDPGCDLAVVFNSPGGSVIDGLGLYDFLVELGRSGHHLTTHTLGMAASMGGILLQAGDVRRMSTNSQMLIHEVSGVIYGTTAEREEQERFVKRLQDRCLTILASRSNLTKEQIRRRWKKKDWWLSADEALEHGFIDEIS